MTEVIHLDDANKRVHTKEILVVFIDSHPKLAYALSDWLKSGTRGHFQINRADKNGKYIWNNLISDRE